MVTRTSITLVCDTCGTEDLVDTHSLAIDGEVVEAELCDKCWSPVIDKVTPIYREGRVLNGRKRRRSVS